MKLTHNYRSRCRGIIALTFVICIGCKSSQEREFHMPVFNDESDTKIEIISDELFGINSVLDIYSYKEYIVVIAYDAENDNFLHIFNHNGEKLCDAVQNGRGPKEVLRIDNSWIDNVNGDVGFVNQMQNKMVCVNIDSLLSDGAKTISEIGMILPGWLEFTCPIPARDRKIIIQNVSPVKDTTGFPRITVEDRFGEIIAQHKDFPEPDPQKRYIMYNESIVSISPNGRNLAIGTLWGGILEIYSLEEGLELKNVKYFIKPDFIAHSGYGEPNEKTQYGFRDIDASNEYIYSVINGEVYSELYSLYTGVERTAKLICNNISVFDWTGTPVKKINTDYEIERFCIDENDEIVYAVVTDSLGRPFLGKFHIDI